jgi:F-box-like
MSVQDFVPTEILLEIFQQALPPRLDQDGRLAFKTIRCVCSKWRTISFSSPTLWSAVSVKCREVGPDYHYYYVIRLGWWFSRAGSCSPLELDFVDQRTADMSSQANKAMMGLILRHQSQWRYLSLFINTEDYWDMVSSAPPSRWSNLHCLCVWTYDCMYMEEEKESQGLDALDNITSLRRLVLNHAGYYEYTRRIGPVGLPELQIHLDMFAVSECSLISTYSTLTKLTLVSSASCSFESSPNYHLTLNSLTHFSFDTYDLSLLCFLTAPSLTNLNVQVRHMQRRVEHASLTKFLSRCANQLTTFALYGDMENDIVAHVLPSLSAQPCLTHLSVDKWLSPLETGSMETLKTDWCPNLEDLDISLRGKDQLHGQQESIELLVAFLTGRQGLGLPPLERLTIRRDPDAIDFPYESFENIQLRELRVLVPL